MGRSRDKPTTATGGIDNVSTKQSHPNRQTEPNYEPSLSGERAVA